MGASCRAIDLGMTTPELTEERIDEAMARAEKVACSPGDVRCYPFPD